MFRLAMLGAIVVLLAGDVSGAQLIGMTAPSNGTLALFEIDIETGLASPYAEFAVRPDLSAQHLTYHGPTNQFITRVMPSPPAIGLLHPVSGAVPEVPIVGLPHGQSIQCVEYQSSADRLLVTFGNARTNYEPRVAQIDLDGKVLNISPDLGLGDRDVVAENPVTGNLLAIDTNGSPPRLAIVEDVFGSPQITPVANPPENLAIPSFAISPDTGTIFAHDNTRLSYVDVGLDSYVNVGGTFGLPTNMRGIAFIPEPGSVALLACAALGPLAFGWRKRSPTETT